MAMTVKKEPAVIKHAFINFSENSVAKKWSAKCRYCNDVLTETMGALYGLYQCIIIQLSRKQHVRHLSKEWLRHFVAAFWTSAVCSSKFGTSGANVFAKWLNSSAPSSKYVGPTARSTYVFKMQFKTLWLISFILLICRLSLYVAYDLFRLK